MRLFVAVNPPQDVTALVEALPRPNLKSLRWTTRDQWHVTLRFLGEVADAESEPLVQALREVPQVMRASATGTGTGTGTVQAVLGPAVAWFSGRRILQVPVHGMDLLAEVVTTRTAKWGQPPDGKPFSGHLTLARVRGRGRGPVNLAGTQIRAEWSVGEIVLVSSMLGSAGARYSILETVPLRR